MGVEAAQCLCIIVEHSPSQCMPCHHLAFHSNLTNGMFYNALQVCKCVYPISDGERGSQEAVISRLVGKCPGDDDDDDGDQNTF